MGRKQFVELMPKCETCGGDGSAVRPFDGYCPAAWAHQFVEAPWLAASTAETTGATEPSGERGTP